MKRLALLLTFANMASAGDCTPPEVVATRLIRRFTYLNGLGNNRPHDVHFSMATVKGWLSLRQDTVAENYVPNMRPVWVFDGNNGFTAIRDTNCPEDAMWVDCAAYWRTIPKIRPQPVNIHTPG